MERRKSGRERPRAGWRTERSDESQRRGKKKRRSLLLSQTPPPLSNQRQRSSCDGAAAEEASFPQLLLAAYSNVHGRVGRSLLKRLLRSHLSYVRRSSSTSSSLLRPIVPDALLALLPPLLILRRYAATSILAADVVGAIALSSMEANEMLAMDAGVMNAIAAVLGCGTKRKRVVTAICNALLDISTTAIGRRCLRESLVLTNLLSIFCQVTSPTSQPLCIVTDGQHYEKKLIIGDRFTDLILSVSLTLINSSRERIPSIVPEKLATCFLAVLKEIWFELRFGNPLAQCLWKEGYISSMGSDVAETIFRLSLNEPQYSSLPTDTICKSIFGDADADLWFFFESCWEHSPFLLKSSSTNLEENNVIFTSLVDPLAAKTCSAVLNYVVKHKISCPPIASDELDILSFIDEAKTRLGSPLIYGQDIRVVKTVRITTQGLRGRQEEEVHFFNKEAFGKELHANDIQKCKDAFEEGYTIALRGMTFRSKKISAISDGLADIFGLPSVGANVYLTPPGSQGLSLHFDDHCVFVCQLLGRKKWNLCPCQKKHTLPRLYENYGDNLLGLNERGENFNKMHLTLQEGDILYIPRGCPHEAQTITSSDGSWEETGGLSLHLTLAVEVEPPFEWEGFIHISLHCWREKQKRTCPDGTGISYAAFTHLMHIAISVLASKESAFRRACLVAANFPPGLMQQHILHQKSTFIDFICKIDGECIFCDAFKLVEGAVKECNNESFPWPRWLRHLPQEGTEDERMDFDNPLESFRDIVLLASSDADDAKVAFEMVKSKFCSEVVFEDACQSFVMLLDKYRGTRRQYTNGMLSLHPNI